MNLFKRISAVLTACISFCAGAGLQNYSAVVNAESTAIAGDICCDGKIDLYDAIEIAKYLISMVTFDEEQLAAADYNRDGEVDLYDVIGICRQLLEEIGSEEEYDLIEIKATDENDYVYVEEGNAFFNAKKKGYYAIARNIQGLWYGKFDDETQKNKEGYENYEDAFIFGEYEKDAKMTSMSMTGNTDFYIAYSTNGTDIEAVLKITPQEVKPVIPVCSISASATVTEETSEHAVFSFDISVSEGYSLTEVVLYKKEDNGDKTYYDMDSVLGESNVTLEYEFLENGEYKMTIYASDGSNYYLDISVANIEDEVENIDDVLDTKAPELTIITDDAEGLEYGEAYYINVSTDEVCNIFISNQVFYDVTSAVGVVLTNGTYTVKAVDESGNMTIEEIIVTAFNESDNAFGENENPLSGGNKDSFWNDVNSGDDEEETDNP